MMSFRAKATAIAAGTVVAVAGLAFLLSLADDGGSPADNDHAAACAAAGHTIKEKSQFGGRYSTYTWWCVDRAGRITDIWFD